MIVSSVQAAYLLGVRHGFLKDNYLAPEYRRQQQGGAPRFTLTFIAGAGRGHGYRVNVIELNNVRHFVAPDMLEAYITDYQRHYGRIVTTASMVRWVATRRQFVMRPRSADRPDPFAAVRLARSAPEPWHGVIKMGADPEFELRQGNRHIHASNYFSGNGQVGTDGASSTGEIRPRPGTPEQVAENVRACLIRVSRRLGRDANYGGVVTVHGGAGVEVPLGGHIHFGGLGIPMERVRASLLDSWVSEPLNRYCSAPAVRMRASAGYGRMGAVRDQPHGWEYRAPCSWLAHPVLTKGALLIAYLIAEPAQTPVISRWEDILNLTDDEDRKAVIRDFYTFQGSNVEQQDLLENWGLRDPAGLPVEEAPVQNAIPVEAGSGTNVGEIVAGMTASRRLRVIGFRPARFERSETTIYYDRDLHLSRFAYNGMLADVTRWNGDGTGYNIYLSRTLRSDIPRARLVLQNLIDLMATHDLARQEEEAYA